jgi:hypothetical protein
MDLPEAPRPPAHRRHHRRPAWEADHAATTRNWVLGTGAFGPDAPARADELAGMLAADWVRLVIHPETVSRFNN